MCTLLYLPFARSPFHAALGLNRDEAYARPAAPPRWWPPDEDGEVSAEHGRGRAGFLAPVDLVAGGTWFGMASTGLFVALTNGRQPFAFQHTRSRGALVTSALRAGTLDRAVAALVAQDALDYAPCHLFLAQGERAAYVAPDPSGRFAVQPLGRGPHTLTNAGLDLDDTPELPRDTPQMSETDVQAALHTALAAHAGPKARCHHGDDRGTRSSALLLLADDLSASRLRYAEGPPCITPYEGVALPRTSAA